MTRPPRLLLSLIMLVVSLSAQANVLVLDKYQPKYFFGDKFFLLEDDSCQWTFEAVSYPGFDAFTPYSRWTNDLQTHTTYWGKLEIENRLPEGANFTEWVLTFTTSLTEVTVFQEVRPGIYEAAFTGTHQPRYVKSFVPTSEGNFLKVSLPPGKRHTLYFKALAEREALPPEFDITLEHLGSFYEKLNDEKRNNSLFLGFVLMMLFYNIIMFVFLRDKAYLYYSLYLFFLSVYVAYKNGDLADLLEPVLFPEHPEYITFAKLSVHLTIVSYLAFIRKFSNLKVLLPKWDRLVRAVMFTAIPFFLVDAFLMWSSNFSYNVSDWATIPFTLIFLLIIFSITLPMARTGNKKSRFIVAGIAFLGIGILITVWFRIQSYEFTLVWFKAGTILDIIAFSLGLAYHQQEIEKEKQLSIFQLEKNKILQEKVEAEARQQKQLNLLKSGLYTNITHEFRTPLMVILGMAGELKENGRARELIVRNAENLLHMINQMLDLAKLDSGKFKLKEVRGEIVSYLKYLTESFHSLAANRGIRLHFQSQVPQLTVWFDRDMLRHIVYNLLSNALKFTDEGGRIDFKVSIVSLNDKDALRIEISDNGCGIAEEDIKYIFDRFFQAEKHPAKNTGGTGIGLSLTKKLVGLMEGEIHVESRKDIGTTFSVVIPFIPADKAESEEAQLLKSVYPFSSLNGHSEGEKSVSTAPDRQGVEEGPDSPQLLLIEDNPDVLSFMIMLLQNDYQIEVATDGKQGVEKAIELVPDVIISDVMMPEMSGFEVCEILKSDERTSHIPVILLTAKSAEEDRINGLRVGADAYLMKPFNKEELFVRLEKLVELRSSLQEYYARESYADDGKAGHQLVAAPTLDELFLEKLRKFIIVHLDNSDLQIEDVCQEMHMSHTQLYRKLKALTGKSPVHFIRKIRLNNAMSLLKTTEFSISEIAYRVGFNDPNYFSRIFQQEFEMPPSLVRK